MVIFGVIFWMHAQVVLAEMSIRPVLREDVPLSGAPTLSPGRLSRPEYSLLISFTFGLLSTTV